MKIKNLMLKNFAKVSEISVNFDENITYLVGINGAGKTTVGLNAIWFIFKGLAQKGEGLIAERFRFIGPAGKSAQGSLTIYDESESVEIKISRKLLKNKTELKIEASDGRQLDQAWLDSIFNSFLIDPMGFSKLSGKEQAFAFGADTASFDGKKKRLEVERRDIGRDVKRLQGVVLTAGNPAKVEAVDVAGLMKELGKRQELNDDNRREKVMLNNAVTVFEDCQNNLLSAEVELQAMQKEIAGIKDLVKEKEGHKNKLKLSCSKLQDADEQEIKDQVENAQGINLKASAYEKHREDKTALDDTMQDYEGKTDMINIVNADRTNYLKSLNLPWPNISITDEGEFRLNDKPFCAPYFSTGEILKFGARIGSKLKDGLKYVFFPSSNVMDEKNREATFKALVDEGYQIVAEFIDNKKIPDANCILLKERQVVESYDDSEGGGLK